MTRSRLEAFSDGVMAILITIMVLELRPPESASLASLRPLLPSFLSYALSFVYLAIWWNNHHHLFHTVSKVDGRILWANLHLLFWLSLFPFVTAWVGKTRGGAWPTAFYGAAFFMAATAWVILEKAIIASQGKESALKRALGSTWKEKLSSVCYLAAIGFAFVSPRISFALYVFVALLWVVPDPRIERQVA